MNRVASRSVEDLADVRDLRSVISAALSADPIDERRLRCAVWTFVGVERRAGVPPAIIIMRLTNLVVGARVIPPERSRALAKRTTLWCVEEYFGRLGGNALAEAPSLSSRS